MNNHEEIVGTKTRYDNSTDSELKSYLYCFQNNLIHSLYNLIYI